MRKFKKLFIYIFISVLLTQFVTNICLKIDDNYFENFTIAITNSEEELLDIASNAAVELAHDDDMLSSFQETYDYYYSNIPANVENKEGYVLAHLININLNYVEIFRIKQEIQIYTQSLIAGIIFGLFLYIISTINLKFTWLRLLLGFVIFLAVALLAGGFVIGIKYVIYFHLAKYILWSLVAYIVIIGINLVAQKIKINKLNNNLNKTTNK